jgi:hypothetical protein
MKLFFSLYFLMSFTLAFAQKVTGKGQVLLKGKLVPIQVTYVQDVVPYVLSVSIQGKIFNVLENARVASDNSGLRGMDGVLDAPESENIARFYTGSLFRSIRNQFNHGIGQGDFSNGKEIDCKNQGFNAFINILIDNDRLGNCFKLEVN